MYSDIINFAANIDSRVFRTREATGHDPFIVMLIGMLVVFAGLALLILIVKLVGLAYRSLFEEKTVEKNDAPPVASPALALGVSGEAAADANRMSPEKRSELAAAISVAIAESLGKPVSGIRIRSIRKLG